MSSTADAIVTALSQGPATAHDLSQRLPRISYSNIRQTLSRLAKSGSIVKLERGLYGTGHSNGALADKQNSAIEGVQHAWRSNELPDEEDFNRRIAAAWNDFEGQNNPFDWRAWR